MFFSSTTSINSLTLLGLETNFNFYNIPPNKEKLKLVSRPNKVKEFIDVVEERNIFGQIKPFHSGETLKWQVDKIIN